MKDGQPFETEDLERLRASQRETLRAVPGWLLDSGRFGMPERDLSGVDEAAYTEWILRERAAGHMEQVGDLIVGWREASRHSAIYTDGKRDGSGSSREACRVVDRERGRRACDGGG